MRLSLQFSLTLILAALMGSARADVVVYDNLATSPSTPETAGANVSWPANAQSFVNTAGGTACISSISLNLFRGEIREGGGFQVQVWSDTANKPTSQLATLLTANWADVSTNSTTPFTANSSAFTTAGQTLELAADTTYWLAVVAGEETRGQNIYWAFGTNPNLGQTSYGGPPYDAPRAYDWAGGTWTGYSLGGQITVVSVPEPGTLALGATLLVMAPLLRRLKRARR